MFLLLDPDPAALAAIAAIISASSTLVWSIRRRR